MAGPPSNLLAGLAGLATGLADYAEKKEQRKQADRQYALQIAQAQAAGIRAKGEQDLAERHQTFLETQEKDRLKEKSDAEALAQGRLNAQIAYHNETSADKRFKIASDAARQYGGTLENFILGTQTADGRFGAGQALSGVQPQGQPMQPQGGQPMGAGNALGATGQNPFTGAPPPPQGAPPQAGGFDSNQVDPNSKQGIAARMAAAQIKQREASASSLEASAALHQIMASDYDATAKAKLADIHASTKVKEAEQVLKEFQGDATKALTKLRTSQTALNAIRGQQEKALTSLTETRQSIMKEQGANPFGSQSYMKWESGANGRLSAHYTNILGAQTRVITEIDKAKGQLAGWKSILASSPPPKPADNASAKEKGDYNAMMTARTELPDKIAAQEVLVSHMEQLNEQYEAEKAATKKDQANLGLTVKKPGSDKPDTAKTDAAKRAAAAAAEKARKTADKSGKLPVIKQGNIVPIHPPKGAKIIKFDANGNVIP